VNKLNIVAKGPRISYEPSPGMAQHTLTVYTNQDFDATYTNQKVIGCSTCKSNDAMCEGYKSMARRLTVKSLVDAFVPMGAPFLVPLSAYASLWAPVVAIPITTKQDKRLFRINYVIHADDTMRQYDHEHVGMCWPQENLQALSVMVNQWLLSLGKLDDSAQGGVGCKNPDNVAPGVPPPAAVIRHNAFVLHYGKCEPCLIEDVNYQTFEERTFW
jgi:hypothetical protein